MTLFRWLFNLTTAPRLHKLPEPVSISLSHAVLCETCQHIVTISGFIPHLSGPRDECPRCGCTDLENLKLVPAWFRTPEEQKEHWIGRKVRTGKVTAINGGKPLPLPKRTITVGTPKEAA